MLHLLRHWLPLDASVHGPAIDNMIALVHWLMAVLFVGWGLYFIVVLLRFRAGRNPQASYAGTKSHISTYSEVAVAVVEAVLLIGFAIPAWARWVQPHRDEGDALEVRVVGEQFAWNVQYPGPDGVFGASDPQLVSSANPLGLDPEDPAGKDDVTTVNQLYLPVNRPITVHLTTKDVIHSFSLPYMRVKQDAIPGMVIPVRFTAAMTTPAESRFPKCAANKSCWEIACAQLCGLGHFRMRGYYTVLDEPDFDQWMAEQVAKRMPQPAAEEPTGESAEPADAGTAEGQETAASTS